MSQYFAKSHEVIQVDGDIATLSISNHAVEELGDLVYVELPQVGQQVELNENFIVIESVKAASDVYAPVSGEVIELNDEVVDDPAIVNQMDSSTGWLVKIRMDDTSQLQSLMDEATYLSSIE